MIKIEEVIVTGWTAAIRGMRNPMNSWDKCDSVLHTRTMTVEIGENDRKLMKSLIKGGPDHAKFRRMITVSCDVTAPLYWWKDFDTYKVGTVANSCSTMHKIHAKEFTIEDFSCEHLPDYFDFEEMDDEYSIKTAPGICPGFSNDDEGMPMYARDLLRETCRFLNKCRNLFIQTGDKKYWWQMIQLLPSSYNQKRTLMLNYEVLANIYHARKNHKLDEFRTFCSWIEGLPESWIITGSDHCDGCES